MLLFLQANHALLEEIREINQRLIDTVVDISDEDVDPSAAAAAVEGGEGTIVKCSFSAVALSPNLKSQYASARMVGSQRLCNDLLLLCSILCIDCAVYIFAVTNSALKIACSHKLSQLLPNTVGQISSGSQVRNCSQMHVEKFAVKFSR